eukprot:gene8053-8916_t
MEYRSSLIQKPLALMTTLMLAVWLLILLYTASDRSISDASDFIEARFGAGHSRGAVVPYRRWNAGPKVMKNETAEDESVPDVILGPLTESLGQIRHRIKILMAKLDQLDQRDIKEVKDMIRRKESDLMMNHAGNDAVERLPKDESETDRNSVHYHDVQTRNDSSQASNSEALSKLSESLANVEKEKYRFDRSKQEKELAARFLVIGETDQDTKSVENDFALPSAADFEDFDGEMLEKSEVERLPPAPALKAKEEKKVKEFGRTNLILGVTRTVTRPVRLASSKFEKMANTKHSVTMFERITGHFVVAEEPRQVQSPLKIMKKQKMNKGNAVMLNKTQVSSTLITLTGKNEHSLNTAAMNENYNGDNKGYEHERAGGKLEDIVVNKEKNIIKMRQKKNKILKNQNQQSKLNKKKQGYYIQFKKSIKA